MSDKLFVIDNDYGVKIYNPADFSYLGYVVVDDTFTNAPISIGTDSDGNFYVTTDTWEVWKFAKGTGDIDYTLAASLTDAYLNPGNIYSDMFGLAVGGTRVAIPYKRGSDNQFVIVIVDTALSGSIRTEVLTGITSSLAYWPTICYSNGKFYFSIVIDDPENIDNTLTPVYSLDEDGENLQELFSLPPFIHSDYSPVELYNYPNSISLIDSKFYFGCGIGGSPWYVSPAGYTNRVRAGFNLRITQFGDAASTSRLISFDCLNADTLMFYMSISADGKIHVGTTDRSSPLATSELSLSADVDYFIQFRGTVGETTISFEVQVDNDTWISDTFTASFPYANPVNYASFSVVNNSDTDEDGVNENIRFVWNDVYVDALEGAFPGHTAIIRPWIVYDMAGNFVESIGYFTVDNSSIPSGFPGYAEPVSGGGKVIQYGSKILLAAFGYGWTPVNPQRTDIYYASVQENGELSGQALNAATSSESTTYYNFDNSSAAIPKVNGISGIEWENGACWALYEEPVVPTKTYAAYKFDTAKGGWDSVEVNETTGRIPAFASTVTGDGDDAYLLLGGPTGKTQRPFDLSATPPSFAYRTPQVKPSVNRVRVTEVFGDVGGTATLTVTDKRGETGANELLAATSVTGRFHKLLPVRESSLVDIDIAGSSSTKVHSLGLEIAERGR